MNTRFIPTGLTRAVALLALVMGFAIFGQGSQDAAADHAVPPASPDLVTYDVTFSTSGQSMWGPGAEASPGTFTYELISPSDLFWNESISYEQYIEGYGGGVSGYTQGSFGVEGVFTAGAGTIGVNAPISVVLGIPAADSFRSGDVISITTGAPTLNSVGAGMSATPASGTVGFNVLIDLNTQAEAAVCGFDECLTTPFFDPLDISDTFELVATESGPIYIDPISGFVTGITGTYGAPDPSFSSTVVGGSIVASGSDNDFVDLELDIDKWLARIPGVPPVGIHIPELGQGASGGYDYLDFDTEFNMSQWQKFTFTPGDVEVTFQFPESVEYWVYDGLVEVASGNSSTVTFLAGQRVDFVAPEGEFDVDPTFELASNTFGNETETTFDTAFRLDALNLNLLLGSFEVVGAIRIPLHDWHPNLEWHSGHGPHCHDWEWWGCDDWHSYLPTLHDHGSSHEHWSDPVEFGGVDFAVGPASSQTQPLDSTIDYDLFDGDVAPWELEGFSPVDSSPFSLDPQQPPTAVIDGPDDVDEASEALFTGENSSDTDGDTLSFEWDFGDGSPPENGEDVGHTYADNGVYTVTLTVDDGHGDSTGSTTHEITVNNVAPTPEAGSSQTVYRNELFNVSGTWTDPAGIMDNAYGWAWDLDGDSGVDDLGTAPYGSTIVRVASIPLEGFIDLTFGVTDKDGGYGEDTVTIEVLNRPPDCSETSPTVETIWSPNNKLTPVNIVGFTDPEGDTVTAIITGVFQDEPVTTRGNGNFAPDASGLGTDTANVRAERLTDKKSPGNGRVYVIEFIGDDGHGGQCEGSVSVGVPHDAGRNAVAINDGAIYDSTTP